MSDAHKGSPPSVTEAALPLATMLLLFVLGALFLEVTADLLVLVMLASAFVAGLLGRRRGIGWEEIQTSTAQKLASVLPAVLILLSIGMLIGTWVFSGTIPTLVYYGLELVNPRYLALTAFLTTSVMSLATGTSWGSAGTIGVALMGMAVALEAPLGLTAGAIVSGAYFGDKMSPLSDSTNISAIGAGADLYAHIRNMMYTAVPSFLVSVAVYSLVGVRSQPGVVATGAELLKQELDGAFNLGLLSLFPAAIVVLGIVRRTPPVLAIVASSVVAVILGVTTQGLATADGLAAAVSGFDLTMLTPTADGFTPEFGALVARGGLRSMVGTLLVIIAAFLLAGAMDVSGFLDRLIGAMLSTVRSVFGLIASTMTAGATMISLTSHGGVTALVIGGMFQKAYDENRLARANLSRSIEDSVTIVEPLMPWTVSAVFMATTLGVPTLDYLPWAVFCYCGPVFSLSIAATFAKSGWGIRLADPTETPTARL